MTDFRLGEGGGRYDAPQVYGPGLCTPPAAVSEGSWVSGWGLELSCLIVSFQRGFLADTGEMETGTWASAETCAGVQWEW